MEIHFYQAECGDAARIRYTGNDGKIHNIFIDAGYERTFTYVLADEIQKIRQADEKIDLWIISHIHDDHIGGIIQYIKSVTHGKKSDIVESWYYNHPRSSIPEVNLLQFISISRTKSIGQGDDLTNFLSVNNKLPKVDITSEIPDQNLFGLNVKILSPSVFKLSQLRKKYPATEFKVLEQNELSSVSEAKAVRAYDYQVPLELFNLYEWDQDQSVENGSSISVLTEIDGKKVLWLADSHPLDIISSLNKLGYSKANPLVCDYVKVCHHGSKGNNSNDLYELVRCSNYIMSVNGENKHYLPNKECFARILRNPNRPKGLAYNFYFTYDNSILRSIFKVDGDEVYKKYNFSTHFLTDAKWIQM